MGLEQGLTFDWPLPRWFSARFAALFSVSALAHAAAFFVFQVVENSVVNSPARERGVTLLSSDVAEHRLLLEAVQAEAPTMALSHALLPVDDLLRVPYRSSFDGAGRTFRDVEPLKSREAYPLPFLVSGGNSAAGARSVDGGIPMKEFEGRAEFAGPLASRAFSPGMPVPRAPLSIAVSSPTYWIGVSPSGDVQWVLLCRSSGSDDTDSEALSFLKSIKFEPRAGAVEWADGTVVLGSPPRSEGGIR
jgi:hypothetical protein